MIAAAPPKRKRAYTALDADRGSTRAARADLRKYRDVEEARKAVAEAQKVFGEYTTLSIDELQVGSYQRPIRPAWVKRIVESYDPTLFQPLTVALRESDNEYYVVDGQHRLEVARILGIKRVPCILFCETDLVKEAAQFVGLQEQRVGLTGPQRYHARLMANEPVVAAVDKILRKNGFAVLAPEKVSHGRSRDTFQAPGALIAMYLADGKGELLDEILAILRAVWDGHPDALHNSLVRGLGSFLKRYGTRIRKNEFIDRLRAFAPRDLSTRSLAIVHTVRVAQAHAMAQVLLEIYNRNRPQSTRLQGSILEGVG
jgi:hypothetical protein